MKPLKGQASCLLTYKTKKVLDIRKASTDDSLMLITLAGEVFSGRRHLTPTVITKLICLN